MADEIRNEAANQQSANQDLQNFQQAVDYAVKEQKKKKRKKRLIIFAVIVVVIILISVVFGNSDSKSKDETESVTTSAEAEAQNEENDSENNVANMYNVQFKNAKVTNSRGTDYLIVTYTFTNNSKKNSSFAYSVDCKAFQNGIELGPVYSTYGIDDIDIQLKGKEIQPGKSLDVQEIYELNDKQTDVEIQVGLFASLNDKVYDRFNIKLK